MKSLWGFGHDSLAQADPLVLLASAENPWPRAAGAAPWWPEKEPSMLPKGLNRRQSCRPRPTPKVSAQPVLQVCLAPGQQARAQPLTGRKDVNRGQGAGGGQRRPGSLSLTWP